MIEYTWPGAYQISSVRSTTSWKISIKKKEVLTPNLHLNHKWNQHLLFWCTNQSQLQKKSIWISMELLSPFLWLSFPTGKKHTRTLFSSHLALLRYFLQRGDIKECCPPPPSIRHLHVVSAHSFGVGIQPGPTTNVSWTLPIFGIVPYIIEWFWFLVIGL